MAIVVKAAEFFLYGKKQLCIGDGRLDFQTVFTMPSKCISRSTSSSVICATLRSIEIAKGFAVAFPLLRMVIQLSPAWALSNTKKPNSVLSSVTSFPTLHRGISHTARRFRTSRNVRLKGLA